MTIIASAWWLYSDPYDELADVGNDELAAVGDDETFREKQQDEHDHYDYNCANYQYHDEIDMTGNATTELNIQHGHSEEQ